MTTRRGFCLTHFGIALSCAARLRAQDEPVFTALAQDVPVDTAVTRSQRPFTGLHAEDFVLFDNGEPRAIRAVTTEELPLDLVLVFHTVFSNEGVPEQGVRLNEAMRARLLNGAANVLLPTRPGDRVAFVTHTDPVRIELPFTNDRDAMAAALRRISDMEHNAGFTELLTIEYAVRMLAEPGPTPGRRRLIVRLGTPVEAGMSFVGDAVIRRLWSENIIFSSIEIFLASGAFNPGFRIRDGKVPIGLGSHSPEPDGPMYRVRNAHHIAAATGGDSLIFLDPQNPQDLITRMRQRYILWFTQPEGLAAGQERSIAVELSPEIRRRYPDAVVQARAGYVTR